VHPAIQKHPAYRDLAKRRADIERARRAALEAGEAWERERVRLASEYGAATQAAMEAGEAPPPPPTVPPRPDTGDVLLRLNEKRRALDADEKAWYAEHAADLLDALRREEQALAKKAAGPIAKLEELTDAWSEIAQSASEVCRAAGIHRDVTDGPRRYVKPEHIAAGVEVVPPAPPATPARELTPAFHEGRAAEHHERLRAARQRLATQRRLTR
jgi:hypothetical protein